MRTRFRKRSAEETFAVQAGSTVKRDVYKAAAAGVTGVTAFGALAVTGAVAGTAAHDQSVDEQQVAPPTPPAAQAATQRRKHRTIVRTRILHATSAGGVATSGSGGVIRAGGSGGGSGSTNGGSGSGGSTGSPSAPKPAAPAPPPPAPAPSSGS